MQKHILSLFWRFTRNHPVQRSFALVFPVIAVTINTIVAPYILSIFIDRLQVGDVSLDKSWPLIATYAAIVFTSEVLIWRLALYFTWTFQVHGQRDLSIAIFDKLSREDLSFHANRFGGALVSQSTKLVGAYERFWDMIIWTILPMISTIIGSIIVLSFLGLWQYGLFLVIYAAIFGTVVFFVSKSVAPINRHEAAMSTKANGYLADMVTNVATVKAFGRERYEHKGATRHIDEWRHASGKLKWGVLKATSIFSSMYAFGAVAAFVFAVLAAQNGIATAGMVYLVFIYALNINRQLWEFNSITRIYNRVLGDADEMTQILQKKSQLTDHSDTPLHASKGKIVFKDVDFAYDEGRGEQVFKSFALSINARQRLGVVGHSGSGKTTLTKLLLRFSDIDGGEILIDGQDIAQVTQESLHQSISYVAQEPMLFHRSLKENIAYGKLDATDQEIRNAAELAHALEFIEALPDGFDTLVGERGVKLSGGQRQRIAIARAILKDAPILVLDEATSALDSESEKLIQDSLEDLMRNRTSIVIAHRLSTIAKLDRIVVLEGGTIVEDGTHAELIKKDGVYAKLWAHQSGGFIDE